MLKEFNDYLLVNGIEKKTAYNYTKNVKVFLKNVKKEDISEEIIAQFLLKLQEKLAEGTCNNYRKSLKKFINFLKKDIEIPKSLKVKKKLKQWMPLKYLEQTVIPIIKRVEYKELKMRAILYFLYYTGIRLREINNIKRDDFNFKKKELKVYIPKKKEERIVTVSENIHKLLQACFTDEDEETNAFNMNGEAIKMWMWRKKHYFPEINFHPHLFRISFANHYYRKGVSLEKIQEMMGHSSIETTQGYIIIDKDIIHKAQDEADKDEKEVQ